MEEYRRLYDIYVQKSNEELLEILNPINGHTKTAVEVATDILLHERNQALPQINIIAQGAEDTSKKGKNIKHVFESIKKRTLGILNAFQEKVPQSKQSDASITIQFGNEKRPEAKIKTSDGISDYDLEIEYVRLSTSGDENVCPMCSQFEDKIFPFADAPELPLCPSCACGYEYYYKGDLPAGAIISKKEDFILPAECTSIFYQHQHSLYKETDTAEVIRLCEQDLNILPMFMAPYLSAGFPAPDELVCRDLLPELYMQFGQWDKAEKAIKKCITAKAYYPEDGSDELSYLQAYQKVAVETLSYLSKNPGCLQRNIYKKMGYEGEEKELLKNFIRCSKLINKVKYNNTNQLFCNTIETTT